MTIFTLMSMNSPAEALKGAFPKVKVPATGLLAYSQQEPIHASDKTAAQPRLRSRIFVDPNLYTCSFKTVILFGEIRLMTYKYLWCVFVVVVNSTMVCLRVCCCVRSDPPSLE